MKRHPRLQDEAGSATVEYTGATAAAAVVVIALLLAAGSVAPGVGDRFRWALCMITTLGQGSCGAETTAEAHRPIQPCVVSSDSRSVRQELAVVVVTVGEGRRFEVAHLSDGRYRVTLLEGESVGLETGVGGGITLTVNDRTVGGSATADAGISLDINDGLVWYTSDPEEVERMLSEDGEDALESQLLGDGLARGIWERGQDFVGWVTGNGDYEFPDPDETYSEGGFSADASAEATFLTEHADVGARATEVLGVRETRDERTTVYLRTRIDGEAGLQSLGVDVNGDPQFQGVDLSGNAELVTAVTYDADGTMREVSMTAVAGGESKGAVTALFGGSGDTSLGNTRSGAVMYQATLPIRDDVDREIATDFLVSAGVTELGGLDLPTLPHTVVATSRFIDAAHGRGYTTRQTFETDSSTDFALDAEGKLGVQLGGSVSVESATQVSSGAEYWDGTQWVGRGECVG